MNEHENASRLRKSGKEKMIAIENTVHLQGKDAMKESTRKVLTITICDANKSQ